MRNPWFSGPSDTTGTFASSAVYLDEKEDGVAIIDCDYPLIHQSNDLPVHFIHGLIEFLNQRLDLQIRPTAFKGDIYISELEKSWFSQVHEIVGQDIPFWIVVAGGKNDFTIKWWDHQRFQTVIDHFQGRILFVQVGERGHNHPPLKGNTVQRALLKIAPPAMMVLS